MVIAECDKRISGLDQNLNHKMNGAQKIHFVIKYKCLMIFRRCVITVKWL